MEVQEAVGADKARQLSHDVEAELLQSSGFVVKASKAMAEGREPRFERHCLLLLGPSAAGKSRLVNDRRLLKGCPEGAMVLDGGYIRDVSESWTKATSLAKSLGMQGFADYFERFFKPSADKVKEQIVESALASGANIIVPDTASSLQSMIRTVDRIVAAGYTITFAAVYANRALCEVRGSTRSEKKYSSKNWEASVQAISDLYAYLRSAAPASLVGDPQVICNNCEPHAMGFGRATELLAMHRASAGPERLESRWCEAQLLAGLYEPTSGDAGKGFRIEVVPLRLDEETGWVSVAAIRDGELVAAADAKFDVASCRLAGAALGTWQLGLKSDGQVTLDLVSAGRLSLPGTVWRQVCDIKGVSLAGSATLASALEGADICRETLRAPLEHELAAAAAAARLTGPNEASSRASPSALLVVGPSGSGKSRVIDLCAGEFGGNPQQAVVVDSEAFKECHAPYRALLENGRANQSIWFRSWPAAKGAIAKAKSHLLDSASKLKKDLLISDTGSESERLLATIAHLQAQGYVVNLCCIFADPEEIVIRGVARELSAGKRYNRDLKKLRKSFDAFQPAIRAINGEYKIVRNTQGKQPEIYMQGRGGSVVDFDLAQALAWTPGPVPGADVDRVVVEPCDVAAKDLEFVMEGNRNIVFAYSGDDSSLRASVLRCLKTGSEVALHEHVFYSLAAETLFGTEYVDRRRIVGLSSNAVRAIDEVFLEQRPAKRRCKRLDATPTHRSGRVLAFQAPNLLLAPLPDTKLVTVELKPKCGLRERLGLPSRFQLLQLKKLSVGKESRPSHYDPIKLLSKRPELVREALESAFAEPQNTVRVFVGGKLLFSEDSVSPTFDQDLAAAGFPGGRRTLISSLVEVLASPGARLAERLKRVQAWAAGETAQLAGKLYEQLVAHHGPAEAERLLQDARSVALALEGIEALPCDETGVELAGEQMCKVFEQVRSRPWDAALEREVVRWCCRLLLGRMAHDVSVMLSFAHVRNRAPEIKAKLAGMRFRPLDSKAAGGCWVRTTVVDIDQKDAAKLPEYAGQLDELTRRFFSQGSFAAGAAMAAEASPSTSANGSGRATAGGHGDGAILFEGATVWKRDQGGQRGRTELDFYRWSMEDNGIAGLVPRFIGYRVQDGVGWCGLSNILDGFSEPCVLDLKMGTRTWTSKASAEKARGQAKKCASQTGPLGLRVVGGRLRRPGAAADSPLEAVGYQHKRPVEDEAQLAQLLRDYLHSDRLRSSALSQLLRIQAWWAGQRHFAIYASSLFMAYDYKSQQECRVKMIDFANVEPITDKAEDLSGYAKGLETLVRLISALPSGSA